MCRASSPSPANLQKNAKKFQKVLDSNVRMRYNSGVPIRDTPNTEPQTKHTNMKKEFIETAEINEARRAHKCGVKAALAELAPWACRFFRCEGGYYAFESSDDYDTFRKQK